jgi:uncharacterized protein
MPLGAVQSCRRYPVKSFQGLVVDSLDVGIAGIEGDRRRAVIDVASGRVVSAKRIAELLNARADDGAITLPDGRRLNFTDPAVSEVLSEWLGREVVLRTTSELEGQDLTFEMTFDPPDDSAEYYDIPMPVGTFVDLAPVHLLAAATLSGCRELRPDLDWDLRRFRANLVLDVEGATFVEDQWVGHRLRIGPDVVLAVAQPTVRCAMPLRAQPPAAEGEPALPRRPELFAAMGELHEAHPNHLGVYADVITPGTVQVGDVVELVDA